MAKNKVSEWSATPANNTDIGGINIAEGCAPSGINNAIRELMAQVKDMQAGTDADNFTVGGNLTVTGTITGTSTTQTSTDNTTKLATTAFVQTAVSNKLEDTSSNGIVARTADNTATARTITAGSSITVTDGDGVSGNPTIAVTASGITDAQLANNSVVTAKIANANITAEKLNGAQSGSAPIFGARAWVNFDGSGSISANQTIRASGNVSSVYKTANGTYEINFTTAMPDENYTINGNAMGGQEAVMLWINNASSTQTSSKAIVQFRDSNDPSSLTSPSVIWLTFFR